MPNTYTYQWKRVDPNTGVATNIAGATSSTYVVQYTEQGYKVRCTVTADNGSGGTAPADSNTTTVVTNPNTFFNRVKHWHKAAASAVAVVIIGGGALVYNQITTGGSTSWTTVATANVAVKTTGNDSTCARSASAVAPSTLTACATFDKAYRIASQGDTVAVYGGSYAATDPAQGAYKINADGSKTVSGSYVNFKCADSTNVTFASPGDQFVITGAHIKIDGGGTAASPGCFKFNRVWVGDPANGISSSDDIIKGSSMWEFDISGSDSVTIDSSQVGPDIACYSNAVSDGRQCHNDASTNEQYWFNNGRGNTQYVEPMIHFGGSGGAVHDTNINITHNIFEKMNSRDINGIDGQTLHTDCLTIAGDATGGPYLIDGNTFEDCMNIDLFGGDGGLAHATIQNNMFGYAVNDVATGTNLDSEATNSQEVSFKCVPGSYTLNDILMRYNTLTGGMNLMSGCSGVSYTNVRVIGNLIGNNAANVCNGNTIDYNMIVGGTCGTNSANLGSFPVVHRAFPVDLHLTGSSGTYDNAVTPTTSDYALTTDFDSQTRPQNANRDVGADERSTSGSLGGVSAANIWITAPGDTAGSCTRSGSPVAYSASTSCGSAQFLNQAVSAASLGDTIGVPGGTYTGAALQAVNFESRLQNLSVACDPLATWGTANTTNCIRIAPKAGQQPFIPAAIELHAGDIWIDGSYTGSISTPRSRTFSFHNLSYIDTESDSISNYPDHVTVTGFKTSGTVIYGSHNVRFSNMEIGDRIHDGTSANCSGNPNYAGAHDSQGNSFTAVESAVGGRNSVTDTSIVMDHNYLYNVNNSSDPSCDPHDGGMFLHNGVNGLTFDSNVWEQNWVYDIQVQAQGDGSASQNVTMQNNWFGVGVNSIRATGNNTTAGQRGLQFDTGNWANFLIRYNSFDEQGSSLCATGTDCTYTNVRFIGNTGAIPASGSGQPCGSSGVTFDKNAWESGTCSAGDSSMTTPLYGNGAIGSMDFHLVNTSIAPNNLVSPTTSDYTLNTDIDGQTRPIGTNRDAGSDEQ